MNEYFINTDTTVKNSKEQNFVDWTERLEKHLQLPCDTSRAIVWLCVSVCPMITLNEIDLSWASVMLVHVADSCHFLGRV